MTWSGCDAACNCLTLCGNLCVVVKKSFDVERRCEPNPFINSGSCSLRFIEAVWEAGSRLGVLATRDGRDWRCHVAQSAKNY